MRPLRVDGQVVRRVVPLAAVAVGEDGELAVALGARDAAAPGSQATSRPLAVEQQAVRAGLLAVDRDLPSRSRRMMWPLPLVSTPSFGCHAGPSPAPCSCSSSGRAPGARTSGCSALAEDVAREARMNRTRLLRIRSRRIALSEYREVCGSYGLIKQTRPGLYAVGPANAAYIFPTTGIRPTG